MKQQKLPNMDYTLQYTYTARQDQLHGRIMPIALNNNPVMLLVLLRLGIILVQCTEQAFRK